MIPESIKKLANKVRNEIYGRDVRESIAQSMEVSGETSNEANERSKDTAGRQTDVENRFDDQIAGNTDIDEVIDARRPEGGESYPTLRKRLDDEHKEVTTQLAQKVDEEDIYSDRNLEPIELDLKDFSGYNQPYHPSVLYLPSKFADYKYWMVQSPFPIGGKPYQDRWEVPIVYKSNDGINWVTVADPLDDLTPEQIQDGDYMSDPHLIYNEDSNMLEVWYRYTYSQQSNATSIIRKTTADGRIWTQREELIKPLLASSLDFVRSPSILWDENKKIYRMWYQNNAGCFYKTSEDGKTWSGREELSFDIPANEWHIDVNFYRGEYHFLSYSMDDRNITHYTSTDGFSFRFNRILLDMANLSKTYSNLYRAVSLLDEQGKIRIYFSHVANKKTGISLVTANDFGDIHFSDNSEKLIDGSKIVMGDKKLQQILTSIEDNVIVVSRDYFNGLNKYYDFPKGFITQNLISTNNIKGLPIESAGLLITDWTSAKSGTDIRTDNLVFQTFRVNRGKVFVRSTQNSPPYNWGDWEEITNYLNVYSANSFSCISSFSDFPNRKITHNIIDSSNLIGTPNERPGLLITDRTSGIPDYTFQTFKERPTRSESANIYVRSTNDTLEAPWLQWKQLT